MFGYEVKHMLIDKIPKKINDFLLELIFFEMKRECLKEMAGKEKKEDLDNDFFLTYIIWNLGNSDKNGNEYCKRLLNKLNSQSILKKYVRLICNALHDMRYDDLNGLLKSLKSSSLVKDAELINDDKQDYVMLTMNDDKKVYFTHIPLKKNFIDVYRNRCHETVSRFVKAKPDSRRGLVILEKRSLFGSYYHSIMVENDMVYDLTQNIMISYDNYINLFKPKIIVDEYGNELVKNMKELEEKIHYTDSQWVDLIAYGTSKRIHKVNKET